MPDYRIFKLIHSFLHQFSCFAEQYGRLHFQTAVLYQFLCCFGVGALQAHNDRNVDVAQFVVSLDNTCRYPVAANDAAEYVDEDGFYIGVFKYDTETRFYCLCVGAAAYIREGAGSQQASFIISMVAMARPAPFTIQPTLPSSFT